MNRFWPWPAASRSSPPPDLTARFPDKFLARVTIDLNDGRRLRSQETTFRGELDSPLGEAELQAKYHWLAADLLSPQRAAAIESIILNLPNQPTIRPLLNALTPPPD